MTGAEVAAGDDVEGGGRGLDPAASSISSSMISADFLYFLPGLLKRFAGRFCEGFEVNWILTQQLTKGNAPMQHHHQALR